MSSPKPSRSCIGITFASSSRAANTREMFPCSHSGSHLSHKVLCDSSGAPGQRSSVSHFFGASISVTRPTLVSPVYRFASAYPNSCNWFL